jgi:hypothetical protein
VHTKPRDKPAGLDTSRLTADQARPQPASGAVTALNTLDAAVAAARRGWAVFPCRPGDKRPAVPEWQRKACTDPDRVARYWPGPTHNIGIATGPSHLVVLDLDTHGHLPDDWRQLAGIHDGKDVLAQLCAWARQPWPSTHTVATPSGGWHLYFAAPEGSTIRNSASQLGPLVDVRAIGGYVLGAGSVVDGKQYEVLDAEEDPGPLPTWIARLLSGACTATNSRGTVSITAVIAGNAPGRFRGLVRTVETAPVGQRNDALFWAASRAQELVAAGKVTAADAAGSLLSAAVTVGLPEAEARRTIASAMRGDAR